jgi:hypothetical protein
MKQEATSGVFKVLGDQARSHPDRIVNDPFKLAAKLETGEFAYPFVIINRLQFNAIIPCLTYTNSFMNYRAILI